MREKGAFFQDMCIAAGQFGSTDARVPAMEYRRFFIGFVVKIYFHIIDKLPNIAMRQRVHEVPEEHL